MIIVENLNNSETVHVSQKNINSFFTGKTIKSFHILKDFQTRGAPERLFVLCSDGEDKLFSVLIDIDTKSGYACLENTHGSTSEDALELIDTKIACVGVVEREEFNKYNEVIFYISFIFVNVFGKTFTLEFTDIYM